MMAVTSADSIAPAIEPALGVRRKSRTNFELARQRFLRQKLAVAGLVIVIGFLLCAIFAPLIAPTHYATVLNGLAGLARRRSQGEPA